MKKKKCKYCGCSKFHLSSCPLSEEGFKEFVITSLKELKGEEKEK